MSHVLPLLHEMRGRLGMYLGTSSLTRLAAFLRGYDYAVEKAGGGHSDPFLAKFRDLVHNRFRTTRHSWEDTILLHSADEDDAVKRFWELLDDFLRDSRDNKPGKPNGQDDGGKENLAERWRRIGPKLEQVRRAELRNYKHEDHVQAIDALLQIGYEHRQPRTTSGLVVLQQLLGRLRQ